MGSTLVSKFFKFTYWKIAIIHRVTLGYAVYHDLATPYSFCGLYPMLSASKMYLYNLTPFIKYWSCPSQVCWEVNVWPIPSISGPSVRFHPSIASACIIMMQIRSCVAMYKYHAFYQLPSTNMLKFISISSKWKVKLKWVGRITYWTTSMAYSYHGLHVYT